MVQELIVVKNVPVGLGEPVFDRIDADIAKACDEHYVME